MGRRQRAAAVAGAIVVVVGGATAAVVRSHTHAAYVPGERVEGVTASLARAASSDASVVFTDVAREAGLTFHHFHGARSHQLPEDMGSGLAWGDFDGDGDDDLVAVNAAGPLGGAWADSPARTRLFRNDGGRFTDATKAVGLDVPPMLGMAATWADVDGDADLDLLLTGYDAVRLFLNENGRFRDATAESGLAQPGFWSGAAWADYDRDGDLDLYVGRYVAYVPDAQRAGRTEAQYGAQVPYTLNPSSFRPATNALYRNDGHGRFTDVTAAAGVADPDGRTLQVVFSDFDEDGLPDLYVANDVSDNAMYRNRGDGKFEDVSHPAWVADYRGAMGLAVGDFDGDETLDVFVSHWIAQENALYQGLLRKSHKLQFVDMADSVGLGQIALDFVGWGAAFLDYDLDGRPDLIVANGSTLEDEADKSRLVPMRAQLFHHDGPTGFGEVGAQSGPFFSQAIDGRGLAVSDYDRDGDPDVAILPNGGDLILLRNEGGTGHHWLAVRLVGRGANRFAIGARVTLRAGNAAQVREIAAGSSYLSQNGLTALFGLGEAAAYDRIEVRWPDGERSTHPAGPVDREIVITEGQGEAAAAPRGDFWALAQKGRAAYGAGRWEEAVSLLDAALASNPKHAPTLRLIGAAQAELGRFDEALASFRRLLEVAPDEPDTHFHLGALFACVDPGAPTDPRAAAEQFAAVLRLNPEQTGPATRLAEVELLGGDVQAAAKRLAQVTATNADDVAAQYLLGYLAWRDGRAADAAARLAAAARATKAGVRAKVAASAEGDTHNALVGRLDTCRPFARFWTDLGRRFPTAAPTEADARAEYERVRAWHAACP